MDEWLRANGFDAFVEVFRQNRIDLEVLADLGESDLKELGMGALGDRKRFLRAHYRQAADLARSQGAGLFELRALCDLIEPDLGVEGAEQSVERFGELLSDLDDGFDCADFHHARRLADRLAAP